MEKITTDVVIVGGGPSGLMLALELGCRGVPCVLLERQLQASTTPKANATSARTMEHYRRRGFADEVRAVGLSDHHPQDVMYCTRLMGQELARFRMPSRAELLSGTGLGDYREEDWPTPELPHRAQQVFIEPILRRKVDLQPTVLAGWGWTAQSVSDQGDHALVQADRADGTPVQVRGRYVVGCDGARSLVRQSMGVEFAGASDEQREFFGGQMLTLHFRSSDLYAALSNGPLVRPAWQTWIVNAELRGILVAVNGVDEFCIGIQLRPGQTSENIDPATVFRTLVGGGEVPFHWEMLSAAAWWAGYMLVAERFRRGRLFIAGDAAHLFTPTGGMGYNTSVDDAVNLGWKLAAVVKGWAPDGLLDSYHDERRPIAERNTSFARSMAESIGRAPVPAAVEAADAEGAAIRATMGQKMAAHVAREFNIPGLQLGLRYASAIVAEEVTTPPPDLPNVYVPTAFPGCRAPHVSLNAGRGRGSSLLDHYGLDFTLLVLSEALAATATSAWSAAADRLRVPLTIVHHHDPAARALHAADAVLVRPDHHVAWRGALDSHPAEILARACGLLAGSPRELEEAL